MWLDPNGIFFTFTPLSFTVTDGVEPCPNQTVLGYCNFFNLLNPRIPNFILLIFNLQIIEFRYFKNVFDHRNGCEAYFIFLDKR
jgi:hypothetical protein